MADRVFALESRVAELEQYIDQLEWFVAILARYCHFHRPTPSRLAMQIESSA